MKSIKKAIVLVNIGTPEGLDVKSVRKYLGKFLMDRNVIDIPYPLRFLLVRGIITPFRAPRSLEAYKEVWKDDGSPLDVYTKEIVKALDLEYQGEYLVRYAMSYSNPLVPDVLDELKNLGVKEIHYVPMYPQYAQSSTMGALEDGERWAQENPDVKILSTPYYFDHPDFLKTSVNKIKKYTDLIKDKSTKVLFSFHGIPEKHVKKIHEKCANCTKCCTVWHEANEYCYRSQCFKTAADICHKLGISDWEVSFQSRLGRAQWILPYTAVRVKELAQEGVKNLVVIPYAFTVDCLETEEEIENEIKEAFIEAGGEGIIRVSCLNQDFYKVVTEDFLGSFKPLEQVIQKVRSMRV